MAGVICAAHCSDVDMSPLTNTQDKPDNFIAPLCTDEIRILFRDEHILLIDKPSGLLSLSGKNPLNKDSVHFRLVQDFPTATRLLLHA